MRRNPFIYNQPVKGEDFFNREEEVEKIVNEVVFGKSQGSVWITGERQVGKTSLLQYIQLTYADFNHKMTLYGTEKEFGVAFVFANVQYCKTEREFYEALGVGLNNYFDVKIPYTSDFFGEVIKELHETKNIFVIFLIDEFDAFIQNLAAESPKEAQLFLSRLAAKLQGIPEMNYAKPFSFVFTANHNIQELMEECDLEQTGSGLIVESIELSWFSRKDIEELAKHYLSNEDEVISFEQKEIDFCYQITQGYPYFTQKLLALMYNKKQDSLNEREFFKQVKEECGKDFIITIKGWGGDNIPKRTLKKLGKIGHELGVLDKLVAGGIKLLSSYFVPG